MPIRPNTSAHVVRYAAWRHRLSWSRSLYFAIMESSSRQATLGKMVLGIVVTDMDGKRISFGRALGRNLGKIVSQIICSSASS